MTTNFAAFVAWALDHGVKLNGCAIAEVREGGRGIAATRDLASGEVLLRVPRALLMSGDSALRDSALGPALRAHAPLPPHAVLAVHVLHELSKASDSFWFHYLGQLPRQHSTLAHFSDEEAAAFQVPYATSAVRRCSAAARGEWGGAKRVLEALQLPRKFRSPAAWLWALATVTSRTVSVPFHPSGALCPIGDLFNYTPPPPPAHIDDAAPRPDRGPSEPGERGAEERREESAEGAGPQSPPREDGEGVESCWRSGGVGSYDDTDEEYHFTATSSIPNGEQAMMCYGTYTNLQLLEHYGFLLPAGMNGHDAVRVTPGLLKVLQVEERSAAAAAQGSLLEEPFCLQADGAPSWALLAALRATQLPPHQRTSEAWQQVLSGQQLSRQGDKAVFQTLSSICGQLLKDLPTSLDDDEALLEQLRSEGLPCGTRGDAATLEKDADRATSADDDNDASQIAAVAIPRGDPHMELAVEWRIGFKRILQRVVDRCSTMLEHDSGL